MKIWIDIDNITYITLYKLVIEELKSRGHKVYVTAVPTKEIKDALTLNNIQADFIGYIFPFVKNPSFDLILVRTTFLAEMVLSKSIEVGFSGWSLATLYTCTNLGIPVVTYIENMAKKLDVAHLLYEKSYLVVPTYISNQILEENKISLNKVGKCKALPNYNDQILNQKVTREIADKIELFTKRLPEPITA